ncbi:MAG: F0F1 ATP synthase subunit A [Candidatus Margulisbacteria bacterium]|nr:F0F1 ATP synthase subunit A [Candidatus Margulisiibacteriota bacterium]
MGSGAEGLHVWLNLSLLGFDISITSAVLVVWSAAALVFLLAFLATRKPRIVPGLLQNIVEFIYEFIDSQTNELFGKESRRWQPFIFALFCFILICNLLGMVPAVYPITANINITVTLAVMVFLVYNFAGIRDYGLLRYLASLLPKDVPIYIMPLMLIVEILGHLARPFSLAIRLFANMSAGHLVAFTLLSFIFVFKNVWVTGFPLAARVIIGLFEVFVALIQAYVFAYLAALYIGLAIAEEE